CSRAGHPTTFARELPKNNSPESHKIPIASWPNKLIVKPTGPELFCRTVARFLVYLAMRNGCGTENSAARSPFVGNREQRSFLHPVWGTSATRLFRGSAGVATQLARCSCYSTRQSARDFPIWRLLLI